jgi:hypothetical protein
MANGRFTLSTLQRELEPILDKYPEEAQALTALSDLATRKGLKFNVVRRAYRTVQRMRTRRNTLE